MKAEETLFSWLYGDVTLGYSVLLLLYDLFDSRLQYQVTCLFAQVFLSGPIRVRFLGSYFHRLSVLVNIFHILLFILLLSDFQEDSRHDHGLDQY